METKLWRGLRRVVTDDAVLGRVQGVVADHVGHAALTRRVVCRRPVRVLLCNHKQSENPPWASSCGGK